MAVDFTLVPEGFLIIDELTDSKTVAVGVGSLLVDTLADSTTVAAAFLSAAETTAYTRLSVFYLKFSSRS